jgi:group II intron reverse transcriptase/maturase
MDLLRLAYFELKRKAAPGVDGLTWSDYGADLEGNLASLHDRVHRGAYRALPSRRRYIPKPDGRQRPLAIAALEDKIVQRAVVAVLNAVYEEDFLGFSYGFRPRRSQHDALDALVVGITGKKVNYILDADIQKFFDSVSQKWLVRFLEHRIKDRRILRLIQKWLKAGVLEDGVVKVSEEGTGQGSVISPLLANVYLHYKFSRRFTDKNLVRTPAMHCVSTKFQLLPQTPKEHPHTSVGMRVSSKPSFLAWWRSRFSLR